MNIRQKLAELRNLAREGGNVDAAELVALQTQVQAEEQIAELAAEGERTRAEERAAREKAANIATAQETARDLATTSEADLLAAYDAAIDALEALVKATDARHDALATAVRGLSSAGAPNTTADHISRTPVGYSPDLATPTVWIDGQRHHAAKPGDLIRNAITGTAYRDRDATGNHRRLPFYGGSDLLNALGTPDWDVLPESRKWGTRP